MDIPVYIINGVLFPLSTEVPLKKANKSKISMINKSYKTLFCILKRVTVNFQRTYIKRLDGLMRIE